MAPRATDTSDDSSGPTVKRRRNSDLTRHNILEVATEEFADKGFAGARIDEIAERTHTTKRMLYYYFTDKEGLYKAVLERSYLRIRERERDVDVEGLGPVEAIRAIASLTFDHHEENPDFIRLVSTENILRGEHISTSEALSNLGNPAAELLSNILERGQADGVFRTDVDALDVHMTISSFCVFRLSNRYTFEALFGRDLTDPQHRDRLRSMLGDMIIAFLTSQSR
ncbi:MAG: TetR/AcrR family transcriptional regulator [Rhodococcus sp. (in: high G+C Gram-positive bacteria)]|uniref:TetR/AcrR family transcriptional regulator n=1 Tax=unclassified Rhodococcus (in: high G+C Gram-positive bacteria) TaxID=192944 RepID=UPI000A8B8F54|nr:MULTISPECIES: TetR/AcrR family transcriptional regulator [unclassified Rhodococcus (in: high G+C Gram-positive bacteria)]RMB75368.1 TetR/AcrR family transcriptional regulator [Rhodococcus sp. SBT000017]